MSSRKKGPTHHTAGRANAAEGGFREAHEGRAPATGRGFPVSRAWVVGAGAGAHNGSSLQRIDGLLGKALAGLVGHRKAETGTASVVAATANWVDSERLSVIPVVVMDSRSTTVNADLPANRRQESIADSSSDDLMSAEGNSAVGAFANVLAGGATTRRTNLPASEARVVDWRVAIEAAPLTAEAEGGVRSHGSGRSLARDAAMEVHQRCTYAITGLASALRERGDCGLRDANSTSYLVLRPSSLRKVTDQPAPVGFFDRGAHG